MDSVKAIKAKARRKGERLVRLAYQLEHEANAMRSWAPREADVVADLSRASGRAGRRLLDMGES